MVRSRDGFTPASQDVQADYILERTLWLPRSQQTYPSCYFTSACPARRNIDVDTNAAATFKSALYQGTFGDLNMYITALKNGVLG